MGKICVNRSGKSWTVYETNAGGNVLGSIDPNEIFTWVAAWPGNATAGTDEQRVYFKTARGELKYGWILNASSSNTFAPLSDYGMSRVNIYNKNCAIFQTRRAVNVYTTSGAPYRATDPYTGKVIINGTLPINSHVATTMSTAGDSHPDWMYVDYFGIGDPSFGPGFVDVGLNVSSSPSGISLKSSL